MSDLPDLPTLSDLPASFNQPVFLKLPGVPDSFDPATSSEPPPMLRPAELDPSALELARDSPDAQQLPAGLTPKTLFTTPEMSHRQIRLGALLLGLEDATDQGASDAK